MLRIVSRVGACVCGAWQDGHIGMCCSTERNNWQWSRECRFMELLHLAQAQLDGHWGSVAAAAAAASSSSSCLPSSFSCLPSPSSFSSISNYANSEGTHKKNQVPAWWITTISKWLTDTLPTPQIPGIVQKKKTWSSLAEKKKKKKKKEPSSPISAKC